MLQSSHGYKKDTARTQSKAKHKITDAHQLKQIIHRRAERSRVRVNAPLQRLDSVFKAAFVPVKFNSIEKMSRRSCCPLTTLHKPAALCNDIMTAATTVQWEIFCNALKAEAYSCLTSNRCSTFVCHGFDVCSVTFVTRRLLFLIIDYLAAHNTRRI